MSSNRFRFYGKGKRKVDEGRIAIGEFIEGYNPEANGPVYFYILEEGPNARRVLFCPQEVEDFFMGLPDGYLPKVEYFANGIRRKLDISSGSPRLYLGKKYSDLEVMVSGMGNYLEITSEILFDKDD